MFGCAWFSFEMGSGDINQFSAGILPNFATRCYHLRGRHTQTQRIQNQTLFALKMQHFVVKNRYISKCITKNHLGDPDFAALEYAPLPPYSSSLRYGPDESTPSPGS
jgi:hypothetical protein